MEPKKPYTIQEAVTYLAWLGGPKKAPGDGPPGVKTVWMGLNTRNTLFHYIIFSQLGQINFTMILVPPCVFL